jgi:hypothetical protein
MNDYSHVMFPNRIAQKTLVQEFSSLNIAPLLFLYANKGMPSVELAQSTKGRSYKEITCIIIVVNLL